MHAFVSGEHPLKLAAKALLPSGMRQALKERVVERNLTRPVPTGFVACSHRPVPTLLFSTSAPGPATDG
jgi:hypothetical protein